MLELVARLERQQAELLAELLQIAEAQPSVDGERVAELKRGFEELELVAAAATPAADAGVPTNPNPAVLTPDFYATYLLIVLLSKNLNDARFLWKRIDHATKSASEVLSAVWEIGKALWKRDLGAAHSAMTKPWPHQLQPLVDLLRRSTRESATELLSVAYSTISFQDVMIALGFEQEDAMVQYCSLLNWEIAANEKLVKPKPLKHASRYETGLEQLDSLSQSVLHLEQNTVLKLP